MYQINHYFILKLETAGSRGLQLCRGMYHRMIFSEKSSAKQKFLDIGTSGSLVWLLDRRCGRGWQRGAV